LGSRHMAQTSCQNGASQGNDASRKTTCREVGRKPVRLDGLVILQKAYLEGNVGGRLYKHLRETPIAPAKVTLTKCECVDISV
jgi:hypothetical protein